MSWKDSHRCTAHCPSSCAAEREIASNHQSHVFAYYRNLRWLDYQLNKTWEGYCARRRACNFTLQYDEASWLRYTQSKDYPEFQG